ncbi:MAG: OmpH family outer membrane protein, partial [Bacteroidales bacterium]|nr:OmpH family outer membrane protein [Bacteroidales bacterium]
QFVPIKKSPKSTITTATSSKIAHINVDTIMSKYPLVDTLQNRLQRQITSLETDLMNKQNSLQKNMQAYQDDMQSGKIITKDEANRREQQLMNEQQQLITLRDQYDAQIQQLQMSMQTEILDSIKSAVKNLPPENSFDYVLGYSNEGAIFYANPSLDITNDVLTVLNKRFKK